MSSSLRRPSVYGQRPAHIPHDVPALPGGLLSPTSEYAPRTSSVRRKSKVDAALLRKRQSISHGAPPRPHQAPPLPNLQKTSAIPKGVGSVVLDELDRDHVDPEQYLRIHAASGSVAALRKLKADLEGSLSLTATDLQRNVLENYSEFVSISKEITTLEQEMHELRAALEDWKTIPSTLEISTESSNDFGASNVLPKRRAARNSVADLAALRRNQLEALWQAVEGSARLLPPSDTRHLVAETANFVELNHATYKPRQGVHLFLLNDALLVAVKRRAGMGARVRLAADRVYNLSEISVIDLKDGGELLNAIKIKRGKETAVFRAEKADDKKLILNGLKRVAEDLSQQRRKQSIWEAEQRSGFSASTAAPALPSSSFKPSEHFGFGKDDPSGKDLGWIGDVADELDVAIATRDFEQAVSLIEKGREAQGRVEANAAAVLRHRLDQRFTSLTDMLLRDLRHTWSGKAGVVANGGWLVRLGEADRARETFLSGRADLMRKRVRQIKFEGDVSLYISELAMVCFTLIKNTCEWHMAAFRDNSLASGFVRWAGQQMTLFAEMFRRQVYGADQSTEVAEESIAVTRLHGMMLRDVGLDFSFYLESLLIEEPVVT